MFTRRPAYDSPGRYDRTAEAAVRPLPAVAPDPDRMDLLALAEVLDRGGLPDVVVPDQQHAVMFASTEDPAARFRLRSTLEVRTHQDARWFAERGGQLWGPVAALLALPPTTVAAQLRARMSPTRM